MINNHEFMSIHPRARPLQWLPSSPIHHVSKSDSLYISRPFPPVGNVDVTRGGKHRVAAMNSKAGITKVRLCPGVPTCNDELLEHIKKFNYKLSYRARKISRKVKKEVKSL